MKKTTISLLFLSIVLALITSCSKDKPVLTWSGPSTFPNNQKLSSYELNATASVAGTFSYNPPLGTRINTLKNSVTVLFTPNDKDKYDTISKTLKINVVDVKTFLSQRQYNINGLYYDGLNYASDTCVKQSIHSFNTDGSIRVKKSMMTCAGPSDTLYINGYSINQDSLMTYFGMNMKIDALNQKEFKFSFSTFGKDLIYDLKIKE